MKNKKIIRNILIVSSILFIILLIFINTNLIQAIDNIKYDIVKNLRNDTLTGFFKVITNIGGIIGVSGIILIVTILALKKRKYRDALMLVINTITSLLLFVIIKNIVQRPRPPLEERLIEETSYSFPSGHSTVNMALYLILMFFIFKYVKNTKMRTIICVLCSAMIILIGFSRIYLGVHYASDVLGGFLLGIACTTTTILLNYGTNSKLAK